MRCRNPSGRVGASLSFYSPGIVWQNEGVGLWTTSKNGVEIVPVWPVAMDDSGRAVDIAGASGMNPGLDDPYDPLVARLWDGRKLTVLGRRSRYVSGARGPSKATPLPPLRASPCIFRPTGERKSSNRVRRNFYHSSGGTGFEQKTIS
ncbi:hypothetical protein EON81_14395 [bacterium]|nr:MAG: hypothetical protein EON81_14395 [bacterium]